MKPQRAAIYARISRDTEGEGLGVQRQTEACQDLADRLGLHVADVYVDNDLSAFKSSTRRPEYDRMVHDVEAGAVDAVIAWNLDRLLRQTKELEQYMDVCQPRGVATYEVTAGKTDLTTPSGRATAKTRGAWAQYESEHKAERIRAQKAQAARAGKHLGGPAPWGWRRVDHMTDDKGRPRGGRFEPDPFPARMLAEGTRMVIAGSTLGDVARYWAAEGVRSGSGKNMSTTQVRRLLLRPRNAGLLTFHGETVSDGWPPVVDLADFRDCEAVLTSPERRQHSEHKYRYLLSGVIRCHCGRIMHGLHSKTRGRLYRCTVSFEHGMDRTGHVTRKMEPVDAYVTAAVVAMLNRRELVDRIRAAADDRRPIVDTSAEVVELTGRRNALSRLFAQGTISEAQLVEGTAELTARLDAIQRDVAKRSGSVALSRLLLSDDPGAVFMDSPVETRREVIRALLTVEVQPTVRRGAGFDPEEIRIQWKMDGQPAGLPETHGATGSDNAMGNENPKA